MRRYLLFCYLFHILFFFAADLIDLLCRKSDLTDYVALCLGEAIEEMLLIAERDNVSHLIIIEVRVYRVGAKGLVLIVKLALASVENKSVNIVA